ncbi:putative dsRNA-binding protein [Methanolobus sp.]|uniref:putative dsRNA-binding protein n=1 Tax=Methanolobus sp. TaxID=1874737 RepID=UPI0025D1B777|nr:putative dsRNA-binding protein [Methanolobus sp.]
MIEALIGAIYLDQGISKSKEFVNKFFDLENALGEMPDSNPKGRVQEKYDVDNVNYSLIEENGPDHDKEYIVGLESYGSLVSTGKGTQVKKAAAEAARNHLKSLKKTPS